MRRTAPSVKRVVGFAVVAIFVVAGAGCGQSQPGVPVVTEPPAHSPAPGKLAADGGFFEDLLKTLPDTPNTRQIAELESWAPFWALLKDNGVERPGPDARPDWLRDGISEVEQSLRAKGESISYALPAMNGTWICCPGAYTGQVQTYPYVGFDLRNVDYAALTGVAPHTLGIVEGSHDPERTGAALAACDCDQPKKVDYLGSSFYQWGGDFQQNLSKRLQPPLYDQLGRGGRLVVGKGYALYALWDEGIESAIDARAGRGPVLDDSPDYRLAARGLQALGAYYGAFSARDFSIAAVKRRCGTDQPCPSATTAASQPLLEPFSVAALGIVRDDSESHIAVVLVQNSPEAAQANANLLTDRFRLEDFWNQANLPPGFEVQRVEVSSDDRVLLANIYPADSKSVVQPAIEALVQMDGGPLTSK